jgi:hypothetical protein
MMNTEDSNEDLLGWIKRMDMDGTFGITRSTNWMERV